MPIEWMVRQSRGELRSAHDEKRDKKIRELFELGATAEEIAKEMGMRNRSVAAKNVRRLFGARAFERRNNEALAKRNRTIVKMRKEGATISEIASKLGVGRTTVSFVSGNYFKRGMRDLETLHRNVARGGSDAK